MEQMPTRIVLSETDLPSQWYDIRGDMKKKPAPYLNPETMQALTFEELSRIFNHEVVRHELAQDLKWVDIPEDVLSLYQLYRPTPLVHAKRLEKCLDTPATILFKFEGENASGSHKLNALIPQVYYAKKQGLSGIVTETGAGNVGTATAMACAFFGMECKVSMVRTSYEKKAYRREMIRLFGADVFSSPSERTTVGRKLREEYPDTPGSLGCAISEAAEIATSSEDYCYVLGSMFSSVLMYQSIIGLETKTALDRYGIIPDVIIGCGSGGSNFCGMAAPFIGEKLRGERNYEIILVEPDACPSLTKGVFAYDYCDTGKICPLAKMYTLGSDFVPPPIHAGGLRYHGMSPIISQLYHDGAISARSVSQTEAFRAGVLFARAEGIVSAPESNHAIKAVIDEALKCRETGEHKVILFSLSGTGYFDMGAYQQYLAGEMSDDALSQDNLLRFRESLPHIS